MKAGVLVVSHGSREQKWVELVEQAVQAVQLPGDVPVVSSYLELVEGRLIQDGVDKLSGLGVTHLYVLPLFISSGSTHVDDIAQAFGAPPVTDREGELEPFAVGKLRVTIGQPIDDDPEIAALLLDNVRELSVDPQRESLLLVGHGSKEPVFHERWQAGLGKLAERVRALGGYAHAEAAMLLPDQATDVLRRMGQEHPAEAVIVLPLFLSSGYFTEKAVPGRLSGLAYRYNARAILPSPFVSEWMTRQAVSWLDNL
ncbi:cobalamin biosynthesis protein CbiX [Paenibacillaceae bacterium]|nr:cobalamin biosynthesis protein CbiX [Paenibacillaceae bacterium]